jgi:hypothetical protein
MNENCDVQFGDRELATPSFTQLKPAGEGRSILLSFIGKVKQSPYHWLPQKMKGYRCNGEGCVACAAGITQSWSAIALAAGYLQDGGIQIGYVPLSRPAYKEVSGLNGGKPKECNVKLTNVGKGFAFESRGTPARWTTTDAMRKAVDAAQGSDIIEKLLESKLYEKLTNEEWQRVLTGKAVKDLVPEDLEQ